MDFWEFIHLFFACQAIIFAVFLLIKKSSNKTANSIWAIFLIVFAFSLFLSVIYWSKSLQKLKLLFTGTYTLIFTLYGPLFYLYIKHSVKRTPLSFKEVIHFIPFLIIFVFNSRFWFLPYHKKKEIWINHQIVEYLFPIPYTDRFFILIMLLYAFFAYKSFKKEYIKDKEMLLWLKTIILIFISLVILFIIFYVLLHFNLLRIEHDHFITLLMIGFVTITTYFGYMHPKIFNGTPINKIIPLIKYEKTGLSQSFSLELKEKLLLFMEKDKPYLNPDIRLSFIAEVLDIARHHASQVINEHFNMNFFDFINKYRIKEAENLLKSKDNLPISDIAYQAGFNNRVSFYKAFKKFHNITPTEYKNLLNSNL